MSFPSFFDIKPTDTEPDDTEFRATQGDADAQFELGMRYHNGEGASKDYEKAMQWFRKAAEQDHVTAQFFLGSMSDKGKGTPRNYAQAVCWYRKAAEQGDVAAQHHLGLMYAYGRGVPKDVIEGYKLISMVAMQKGKGRLHAGAGAANQTLYELETSMSPKQITEAQKQTAESHRENQEAVEQ